MSMSMVSQANSPRFERVYGSQEAARPERTARSERTRNDEDAGRRRADNDGPGRRNPLVGALMQALKGLMAAAPTAAAAAPASAATSTAASTTPTTATESTSAATTPSTTAVPDGSTAPGELKDAAYAFAKELFSALRSEGRGGDGGRGGHHEHHDHGRHRGHGEYGNFGSLVQRLQSLAAGLGSTAPGTATPVASDATTSPATASGDSATTPTTAPAETTPTSTTGAASAGSSISINFTVTLNLGVGATAAAQESPLLSAFKNLMDKLQPQGSSTAAGPSDTTNASTTVTASPADKLKEFLLNLASALQAGGEDTTVRPGVGSLLNVQA